MFTQGFYMVKKHFAVRFNSNLSDGKIKFRHFGSHLLFSVCDGNVYDTRGFKHCSADEIADFVSNCVQVTEEDYNQMALLDREMRQSACDNYAVTRDIGKASRLLSQIQNKYVA
ncbi:hypothetical protein J6A31_05985 [bacterium]|nr:hypothetical protein [bacterium]